MKQPYCRIALAAAALLVLAGGARASTFAIDELYSNADGTVQYIVLREAQGANGEQALRNQTLTAARTGRTRTFVFDRDLPSAQTAGRRVLLATSGYAALGLAAPDYVLPTRFLPTDGATLTFAAQDTFSYPSLPTDGTSALYRSGTIGPNVATDFAGNAGSVATGAVTAAEFYNAALDHYFVSALAPDIEALDSGQFPGWTRTGRTFRVYPTAASGPANLQPVCRFYIPPQHGDSHFLSASATECAAVGAKIGIDPNYSGYVLETTAAFFVGLPNIESGTCAGDLVPVYRLWNGRGDSNHRYTTDPAVRAQMIARGYVPEGYGPAGVALCAAPNPPGPLVHASGRSPLVSGCDDQLPTGVLFANSEVEPRVDIDPTNPMHLVGVWQQDRWSDGGARALLTGTSIDGGRTWTNSAAKFSRCTGGADVGADFARASDPWVTFAPDGTVHQIAIAFTGPDFGANSRNAVLVSRSSDGGFTWSPPVALIRDGQAAFNDKESITADPHDASFVYAVWDRLLPSGSGPAWFSRTTDGGLTWEPARPIYDPGGGQTLNNQIVVLPNGTLVDFFTAFGANGNSESPTTLSLIRSQDRGATWSAPVVIAASLPVGASDPESGATIRDAADLGSIAVGRDGKIAVVWQDGRTSAGAVDAILFTQSVDGGTTWSPPVRINAVPTVHAFVPTIKIRDDGTMGVTYYDFRNNTPDPTTLPTDYWLTQSTDGRTWRETHVAGPFNLALAPSARGLFLGDYQGLTSTPTSFVPFFAATTSDLADRTDILAGVGPIEAAAKSLGAQAELRVDAEPATDFVGPELRRAAHSSAQRVLERRRHGTSEGAPPQ